MRSFIIILVIFTTVSTHACLWESENCRRIVVFSNNSGDTIYFASSEMYPDTSIVRGVHNPLLSNDFRLLPNSKLDKGKRSGSKPGCYEEIFEYGVKSDTLSIFVFNNKMLSQMPWESVADQYVIECRYDVSLDDLRRRNWALEYPYDSSKGKLKVWTK